MSSPPIKLADGTVIDVMTVFRCAFLELDDLLNDKRRLEFTLKMTHSIKEFLSIYFERVETRLFMRLTTKGISSHRQNLEMFVRGLRNVAQNMVEDILFQWYESLVQATIQQEGDIKFVMSAIKEAAIEYKFLSDPESSQYQLPL